MSTVLTIPDTNIATTESIPENRLLGVIFTGKGDRVVRPAGEKVVVKATTYLMVTPSELGELRDYIPSRSYREISPKVLENQRFLECTDLVSGRGDERELFLRALPVGCNKAKTAFKNDQEHMIKLTLRSLVTIKKALAAGTYLQPFLGTQDGEAITEYLETVPDEVDIDIDLEKKKLVDVYEKDANWRITAVVVTPAVAASGDIPATDEKIEYMPGFFEANVSLKLHSCGESPVTKVAKRAREEEEKEERLEDAEKVSKLLKSVTDVPGARIFTFEGKYDMESLVHFEDADGTQSLMLQFAK